MVRTLGAGSTETLVASIADGAGSALFAEVGSNIACTAIIDNAAAYFDAGERFDNFTRDDALRWCDDARQRIAAEAVERNCDQRDLATTLCVAILAPGCSVFFQIGDGAVIYGVHGIYGVVFWPQSGEYANSTNFLTSDDYQEHVDFTTTTSCCSEIALFTDGLERLALRFASRTPHAPFFDPLFRALRSVAHPDGLNDELRRFLASDSVQSRSDDDKTLILAARYDADHVA